MEKPLDFILENVGDTPIIKIPSFLNRNQYVYLKLENKNPSGTIKDRLAKHIILNHLKYDSFVDTSIGNFAVSLSWFSSLANKKSYFFLPQDFDNDKVKKIRNFGGDIIYVNTNDFDRLSNQARLYAESNNFLFCGQFKAGKFDLFYQEDICKEIINQLPTVNKIVVRNGTGGLLSGMRAFFEAKNNIHFYEAVNKNYEIKRSLNIKMNLEKIEVDFELVRNVQKYLIQKYAIKAGDIGSINTAAAMKLAKKLQDDSTILTFISDSLC